MNVPQFGEPEPGRVYADRPAAFGILERDGKIALVRITKPGHAPWLDLPGGAVDPGEDEPQALVREFGEETGLQVRCGEFVSRADQRFINTEGAAYNNRQAIFEAHFEAQAQNLKIEDDHELVWRTPFEAAGGLRHEAHAWAVVAWLRWRRGHGSAPDQFAASASG